MPGPDPVSLEERVARLERLVARLLEQSGQPSEGPAAPVEPRPRGARGPESWSWARPAAESAGARPESESAKAGHAHASATDDPRSAGRGAAAASSAAGLADHGERWLGRVGVAFVVLAFGFLFKYAFDQGWIGPALRLLLGLVAGTAMLVIGLRLEGSRERYSQYLLGGAIAVFYLVGFASYELYGLVPFAFVFAFMSATTVLAFVLAERQRLQSLALIGAAGGLATPFLVTTGVTNVPGLVVYSTLLLAGAGAIQFLRGWRKLLVLLGFGGLAVMALAVDQASGPSDLLEAGIVTAGILAAWALFGAVPLFRAHVHGLDPARWAEPPLEGMWARLVSPSRVAMALMRVGCIVGSFIAVLELGALFSAERATFGFLFGAGFLVYLAVSWRLAQSRLALNAAAEAASVLLVLAIALVLGDYRVMLPLAVVGAAMHLANKRWGLPGVAVLAHLLFAQLLILVVGRADLGFAAGSPFGVRELGALAAIALALSTSFVLETSLARQVYRIAAHVAFMAWLATQFAPMERGQELTSVSWGIYGIALLLLSLRLRNKGVQLAGLATLGVVAAKLILVDMAQVDVIWRILLFMGFGAAFLGLSYLINREAKSA